MINKVIEFLKSLFLGFFNTQKLQNTTKMDINNSSKLENVSKNTSKLDLSKYQEGNNLDSKYFNIDEFKCKHCNKIPENMPPEELIKTLENIREHFNKPVIINSGYRCPEHNAKVGGAKASRHIVGDAVDIRVKDVKTIDVYNYVINTFNDKPFGIAKKIIQDPFRGFVHIDTRGKKARWDYPGSL